MKKFIKYASIVLVLFVGTIFISACGNDDASSNKNAVYDKYVENVTSKGEIPLSYEEWKKIVEGEKDFDDFVPYIGANGNWWIGSKDTGVRAKGDTFDSVLKVEKTGTDGTTDTYTITFSDGTTTTITINNEENRFDYEEAKQHMVDIWLYGNRNDWVKGLSADNLEYGVDNVYPLPGIDSLPGVDFGGSITPFPGIKDPIIVEPIKLIKTTGFIYKEGTNDIYIVTISFDLVNSEDEIIDKVTIGIDGKYVGGEVVLADLNQNIAVIKVSKSDLEKEDIQYKIPETSDDIYETQKVFVVDDRGVTTTFIRKVNRDLFLLSDDSEYPYVSLVFNEKNELLGMYRDNVFRYQYIDNVASYLISNNKYYPINEDNVKLEKISTRQALDKMKANEEFILYLGSHTCASCSKYIKVLNEYAKNNPNKKIYYINVINQNYYVKEELEEIKERLKNIENRDIENFATPTTIYVKDGTFADAFTGGKGLDGGLDYTELCAFLEGKYIGEKLFTLKENYYVEDNENGVYNQALKEVIEKSLNTTADIQSAYDIYLEKFEDEVLNNHYSTGKTMEESREELLKQKGYVSMEEMKKDVISEIKLLLLNEEYSSSEEISEYYYNKFIEERLPYLVSHVMVKTSRNSSNPYVETAIDSSDAKSIYDIIKLFERGEKFANVANQKSEDHGSASKGGLYYIDRTYGNTFVDEFVYGVLMFDSYMNKNNDGTYTYELNEEKLLKAIGSLDNEDLLNYYKNGFNFVDMSIVNELGARYSSTSYSTIYKYSKDGDEYEKLGRYVSSTSPIYARNIIFNRAFNRPGVSVIGYSSIDEIPEETTNYVTLTIGSDTKYILTDEKGNPIFVVVAQTSSQSEYTVHFLRIDVSSLSNTEEAKKFFTLNSDYTDNYVTYLELMGEASISKINEEKENLKEIIRNNANRGYSDGGTLTTVDDALIQYDMFYHYIEKNNIELDSNIKVLVDTYIETQRASALQTLNNKMKEFLNKHVEKLTSSNSEEVVKKRIPYECIAEQSYYNFEPCKYIENEGFEIFIQYNTLGGQLPEPGEYIEKYKLGDGIFELPNDVYKEGCIFEGWYSSSDYKEDSKVTHIDATDGSVYNKITLYAKWRETN